MMKVRDPIISKQISKALKDMEPPKKKTWILRIKKNTKHYHQP